MVGNGEQLGGDLVEDGEEEEEVGSMTDNGEGEGGEKDNEEGEEEDHQEEGGNGEQEGDGEEGGGEAGEGGGDEGEGKRDREDDDKGEDEGDKDGEVGEEEEEESEEERPSEERVDRKETGSKEGEGEGVKSGLNQPSHTEGMDIGTTASDTQGNTVKESTELLDNTVEATASTRETHEPIVEAEKTSSEAPGAPGLEPAREQRTIDTPKPQQTVAEEDTQPENSNTTAERELSLENTTKASGTAVEVDESATVDSKEPPTMQATGEEPPTSDPNACQRREEAADVMEEEAKVPPPAVVKDTTRETLDSHVKRLDVSDNHIQNESVCGVGKQQENIAGSSSRNLVKIISPKASFLPSPGPSPSSLARIMTKKPKRLQMQKSESVEQFDMTSVVLELPETESPHPGARKCLGKNAKSKKKKKKKEVPSLAELPKVIATSEEKRVSGAHLERKRKELKKKKRPQRSEDGKNKEKISHIVSRELIPPLDCLFTLRKLYQMLK